MGDGPAGHESCCLPPPSGDAPGFPAVHFSLYGEPQFGRPQIAQGSTVYQFVPSSSNPYIHSFGEGSPRDWDLPTSVYDSIGAWHDLRLEVIVHPRQTITQVVGISHGRARFLCGGGVSLFVSRELGMLPDGVRFGNGAPLHRMVAVFGVVTPNPGLRPATYHILPAEYLVDPAVPGLLADLPLSQVYRQLPSPPLFPFLGAASSSSSSYSAGVRPKTRRGGGPFNRYLAWGALFSLIHGFH